jgi:hypothetical protein
MISGDTAKAHLVNNPLRKKMTVQRTQELPELAAPITGNRIKDESVWQFAFRRQSSPTGWFLLAQISGHLRENDSP